MIRKVPFENGEYYHLYNRGVDRRKIFLDDEDYKYFIHILNIFNSKNPAHNTRYNFYRSRTSINDSERLVDIVSFCLMPNHFHMILKQKQDKGISKFLQKIGTGYTHYFNNKCDRSGVLFQGKTKSKYIDTDKYLNYLKIYIELNPLELIESEWKENGVKNKNKARKFLEDYPWRSKSKSKILLNETPVLNKNLLDI